MKNVSSQRHVYPSRPGFVGKYTFFSPFLFCCQGSCFTDTSNRIIPILRLWDKVHPGTVLKDKCELIIPNKMLDS